MDREYEIFECLTDGSVQWRDRVQGLKNTKLRLEELLLDSGNEHFGLHLSTRDIVFGVDVSHAPPQRAAKRIFQIAYADELRISRAELLKKQGHPVISVIGNDAAKTLLTTLQRDNLGIGLFIVGSTCNKVTFPRCRTLTIYN